MLNTRSALCWMFALSGIFGILFFVAGCSSSRGAEALKISAAVPAGVVASAGERNYAGQLTATGGSAPYTWTVTSAPNTFPSGLTLDPAGNITGGATTKGTYDFTVEATDSHGNKASGPMHMQIYTGTNPKGLL